jgi:hypothetical protein
LSPDAVSTPDYIHRTGAPPGFKPIHLVYGVVVFVVWFGVLGFVLTHGRNDDSSVDVYSELPPGFSDSLAAKGVTYEGLSPVDATTQSQVLAHITSTTTAVGEQPLVLRTTFSVTSKKKQAQASTPALMVVIPAASGGGGHVDFVDPTSYQELDSLDYGAASASGGSTSP